MTPGRSRKESTAPAGRRWVGAAPTDRTCALRRPGETRQQNTAQSRQGRHLGQSRYVIESDPDVHLLPNIQQSSEPSTSAVSFRRAVREVNWL